MTDSTTAPDLRAAAAGVIRVNNNPAEKIMIPIDRPRLEQEAGQMTDAF